MLPTRCPNCEAALPDRATFGPLTVELDPPAVYWRGIRHHRPAAEVKTLHLLARRGRVSHLALEMMTMGDNATSAVAKVRVCHLRRWLRAIGAPLRIRTERGWGYALETIDAEA